MSAMPSKNHKTTLIYICMFCLVHFINTWKCFDNVALWNLTPPLRNCETSKFIVWSNSDSMKMKTKMKILINKLLLTTLPVIIWCSLIDVGWWYDSWLDLSDIVYDFSNKVLRYNSRLNWKYRLTGFSEGYSVIVVTCHVFSFRNGLPEVTFFCF